MRVLLLICAFVFSLNSYASSITPTKITRILVGPEYGNLVFLSLDPLPSNRPDCNMDTTYMYVFDGTTDAGKMYLSVALAAHMSGGDVRASGNGLCSIFGTAEDLDFIVTNP